MSTSARKRSACLLAAVLCITVGSSLVVLNLPERTTVELWPKDSIDLVSTGWPMAYWMRWVAVDSQGNDFTPSPNVIRFRSGGTTRFVLLPLLVDILFALTLLLSTACVAYTVATSPIRALRYNLKFLLLTITALSAILAIAKSCLTSKEMILYAPIGFGVMCVIGALAVLFNRWISNSEQTIKRNWQKSEVVQ